MNILIRNYEDKNMVSNMQVVIESANRNSFFSEQLNEMMKVFNDDAIHFKVLSRIAHYVKD